MKNYLDAIERVKTPTPKEEEQPKKWLDGSTPHAGARDTKGFPVDIPRSLVDFQYHKENREAIRAERGRLALEKRQAEESARLAERKERFMEDRRIQQATREVEAEARAAAAADHAAKVAERAGAIKERADALKAR